MWEAKLAWADGVELAELEKQDCQSSQNKGSRIILISFSSLVSLPCPHMEAYRAGLGHKGPGQAADHAQQRFCRTCHKLSDGKHAGKLLQQAMEDMARHWLPASLAWTVTPLFGVMQVDHLGTTSPAQRLPVEEAQGS